MIKATNATLSLSEDRVVFSGTWTTHTIAEVENKFIEILKKLPSSMKIDGLAITSLDTAGALLIHKIINYLKKQNIKIPSVKFKEENENLIKNISESVAEIPIIKPPKEPNFFAKVGIGFFDYVNEFISWLSFFGELVFSGI